MGLFICSSMSIFSTCAHVLILFFYNPYVEWCIFILYTKFWFGIALLLCHVEGSHLRVVFCLLLPGIQLVVGISHPTWASLPFFIGTCVGLVDWSLSSNFLRLFRWLFCWSSFYTNQHCCLSQFPLIGDVY